MSDIDERLMQMFSQSVGQCSRIVVVVVVDFRRNGSNVAKR